MEEPLSIDEETVQNSTVPAQLLLIFLYGYDPLEYLGFNLSIEGLNSPVSPDELLDDMLRMGTFGVGSQVVADASRFTEAAVEGKSSNKIVDTLHLIFPSWNQWKGFKPYLVDKPWMLPVEWCRRVGRYMKKRDSVDFSESRKIADQRLELMRKYGVV